MKKQCNILCFGDSNTWGCCPIGSTETIERFPYIKRWPGALSKILGSRYNVIEEGNPGRTTVLDDHFLPGKNGYDGLTICLDSHQPLELVIIMLGTNDLKYRYCMNSTDISNGVKKLIRLIKGKCLYVGGIPNVLVIAPPTIKESSHLFGEEFLGGMEKSRKLGSEMKKVANDEGCPYIDASSIIESSDMDGIHFSETSHLILAKTIAKKVVELNLVSTAYADEMEVV